MACLVTPRACGFLFCRVAGRVAHREYESANCRRGGIAGLLLAFQIEVPTCSHRHIFSFRSTQIISFQPPCKPFSSDLSQPGSFWQLSDEWTMSGWWSWLNFSRTKFGRQQTSLEMRNLQPGKVKVPGYDWHSFLASPCRNMDFPTLPGCV